jgi:hypothetical protein
MLASDGCQVPGPGGGAEIGIPVWWARKISN